MNYLALPNGELKIVVSMDEQREPKNMRAEMSADGSDKFGCNETMWAVFEALIANTDLEWCEPAWVGALTDAPMLGIRGEDALIEPGEDQRFCMVTQSDGVNTHKATWHKVWAFMEYAYRSPQDDLAETGWCTFQSGDEEDK